MSFGTPPFVSHFDGNQVPTSMGVVGTLGTADTGGTADTLPISIDPTTGAQFVIDLSGAAGTTNVMVLGGTLNAGTFTNTGTNVNVVTGTINALPQISVGTIPQVSVGTIPQVSVGTLPAVNVATGTQQTLGTVGTVIGIGTLSGIPQVSVGTIPQVSVGTLPNTPGGTLGQVTTVSNLTNGSINILTGTVTRLANVGTIESGTFQLNPTPTVTPLTFGTLGTAGGSFFGTLSAASGAGTKHYIQGVDIVVQSGTPDVRILAGSAIQGTGVLAAGQFIPSAGISKSWPIIPFQTGTNSEILYHFVGAGTAYLVLNYWKGA